VNAVLLDTPDRTKAAMLRAVASEPHPKLALGSIAHRFGVPLADLKTIIDRFGYPDPTIMRNHAAALEAGPTVTRDPIPDDGPSTPELPVEGHLVRVDVNRLHPDPDNPRDHLTGIEELADTINEVGLLQPIIARSTPRGLVVVAGHRRLAAVKRLHWTDVPCIIRADMRPDHVIAAMLIENGQRTDLDPIEEARGLMRLKIERTATDLGRGEQLSDLELARIVGRSQPYVSGRLALLSLTAEQQAEVRAGNMKLVEATHHGRLNSGKVGPRRASGQLAPRTPPRPGRARQGPLPSASATPRGRTVGGMACGACWESVIRADERQHLVEASIKSGTCHSCGAAVQKSEEPTS
jgi:ParB family chromosome partitioning protein